MIVQQFFVGSLAHSSYLMAGKKLALLLTPVGISGFIWTPPKLRGGRLPTYWKHISTQILER